MLKNAELFIKGRDKESLYTTYLDLYKYDDIDYKKITKNKLYEEIVNFFIYIPENLSYFLSEKTLEVLVEDNLINLDPDYEDVMALLELCVIYFDKTIDKNMVKKLFLKLMKIIKK